MIVESCSRPQILVPDRRETDAQTPIPRDFATPIHSPTTAEPQKTRVANIIIKHAKPLFPRNLLNCNVEGWRFMGAWKN
jgi:hypothetical protein